MYKWQQDAPLKLLYTVVSSPSYKTKKRPRPSSYQIARVTKKLNLNSTVEDKTTGKESKENSTEFESLSKRLKVDKTEDENNVADEKITPNEKSVEKLPITDEDNPLQTSGCSGLDSSRDDADDAMVIDESAGESNAMDVDDPVSSSPSSKSKNNSVQPDDKASNKSPNKSKESPLKIKINLRNDTIVSSSVSVKKDKSPEKKCEKVITEKSSTSPSSCVSKPISIPNAASSPLPHLSSVPLFTMPPLPNQSNSASFDIPKPILPLSSSASENHKSKSSPSISTSVNANTSISEASQTSLSIEKTPITAHPPLSLSTLTFPTYSTIPLVSSVASNGQGSSLTSASPPPLTTVTALPPYIPPTSIGKFPTPITSPVNVIPQAVVTNSNITKISQMVTQSIATTTSLVSSISMTPVASTPVTSVSGISVSVPSVSTTIKENGNMQVRPPASNVKRPVGTNMAKVFQSRLVVPGPIVPTKPRLGRPPNSSKILAARPRPPLQAVGMRSTRPAIGPPGMSGFRLPEGQTAKATRPAVAIMPRTVLPKQSNEIRSTLSTSNPVPALANSVPIGISTSNSITNVGLKAPLKQASQPNGSTSLTTMINSQVKSSVGNLAIPKSPRPQSSGSQSPLLSSGTASPSKISASQKTNITPATSSGNILRNKLSSPSVLNQPSSSNNLVSSLSHKMLNGGYQAAPKSPAPHRSPSGFMNPPVNTHISQASTSSSPQISPSVMGSRLAVQPAPVRSIAPHRLASKNANTGIKSSIGRNQQQSSTNGSSSINSIAQSLTHKQLQQMNSSSTSTTSINSVNTSLVNTTATTSTPSTPSSSALGGDVPNVTPPGLIPSPLGPLGLQGAIGAYMAYMVNIMQAQRPPAPTPNPIDLSPTNKTSPATALSQSSVKASPHAANNKPSTSGVATPRSAASPSSKLNSSSTGASAPSPRPGQSPPTSAAPTISPPTPEVTITKLPNASITPVPSSSSSSTSGVTASSVSSSSSGGHGISIGRSGVSMMSKNTNTSTNTVSITKRPSTPATSAGTPSTGNKYAVARSPSNASIRQIPNPSHLSHQHNSGLKTSPLASAVSKSPSKSNQNLKSNNNNNNNNNNLKSSPHLKTSSKGPMTNGSSPKSNQSAGKASGGSKGTGHSPLKETGPLPDTSSISKIEHLTKSLPPASAVPTSPGFRFFDSR